MGVRAGRRTGAGNPSCRHIPVRLPAEDHPAAADGLAVQPHRALHPRAVAIWLTAQLRRPVDEGAGCPQFLNRNVIQAGDIGQRFAASGDVAGLVGGGAGDANRGIASAGELQRAPAVGQVRVVDVEIDDGALAMAVVGICVCFEMRRFGDTDSGAVFDPEPPVPCAGAAGRSRGAPGEFLASNGPGQPRWPGLPFQAGPVEGGLSGTT